MPMTDRQRKLCIDLEVTKRLAPIIDAAEAADVWTRALLYLQVLHGITPYVAKFARECNQNDKPLIEDLDRAHIALGTASRALNCIFEGHADGRHDRVVPKDGDLQSLTAEQLQTRIAIAAAGNTEFGALAQEVLRRLLELEALVPG